MLRSRIARSWHTLPQPFLSAVRYKSTSSHAPHWHLECAVAFDIDGVLTKGKSVIPQAKAAMQKTHGRNSYGRQLPYILLTNGGGISETEKAHQLSKMLEVQIDSSQVVLSHSPMQALVQKYGQGHVLVVGGKDRKSAQVAQTYGFQKISTPDDILAWNPSVWPFARPSASSVPSQDYSQDPIDAVLMFHDSWNWGRDMQVMIDLLLSKERVMGRHTAGTNGQPLPLYFSNPDIVWSNEFPAPRFGQGCFRVSLEALYKQFTGQTLEYTLFGKPHTATYDFAIRTLDAHIQALASSHQLTLPSARRYYAIGDNPHSGVFQGHTQDGADSTVRARYLVNDVDEALDLILSLESGQPRT